MVYLTNSHRMYGIKVFRIYRCVTNMINLEFEGIIVCPQLEGCVVSSKLAFVSSVGRVCRVFNGCVHVLS